MTSFQVIIISFFCLILVGTLLLMLPISSRQRCVTSFPDAMFTAVSATCVTGLVVKDTATYWSLFGQAVILMLIQIGGMGVITIGLAIIRASGRKIGLRQRSTMQESISAPQVGGIVKLTGFILKTSLIIEMIGAALLAPVFCNDLGIAKGLWYSLFHSISAFCNAGFDILGTTEQTFPSLTGYIANPLINLVIMLLIVIGGIGFLTWDDIYTKKYHFRQYCMQSKVILLTSLFLIFVPAAFVFLPGISPECRVKERTLCALFQSVTTRTAGFNTADLSGMTGASQAIMIVLMMNWRSTGYQTAGGMKITTFAVLTANASATFRQREDTQMFGRRVGQEVLKNASTILMMYLFLVLMGGMVISVAENLPISECLFETASAVGTVGLTLGITPRLGVLSKGILIALMFLGRVGGLTLVYAAMPGRKSAHAKMPLEKINVG